MKYSGYMKISECLSFWTWLHHSWNYIGTDYDDTHICRRIGTRWFGHEWKKTVEIPMGELRF